MMKILGLFLLGMFPLSSQVYAQKGPAKPLVVLVEQNPWLMVIGSDSPSFALYDDGLLVYLDKEHEEYRSVLLAEEDLKNFVSSLEIKDLFDLNDSYELTATTDQPTNILFVRNLDRTKKISVYGDLSRDPDRLKSPKAFLSAFEKITSYKNESAKPWVPEKIEVMIWPYEYAPEGSLNWPDGWADIKDPQTKARREGSYSLFLDSKLLGELESFMGRLKEKQAVLINGKKYTISYRYPFPAEGEWMR